MLDVRQRVFIAKLQHNLFSPEEHDAILQSWSTAGIIDRQHIFVTIPVPPELWEELHNARGPHESFNKYIERLVEQYFPEAQQ